MVTKNSLCGARRDSFFYRSFVRSFFIRENVLNRWWPRTLLEILVFFILSFSFFHFLKPTCFSCQLSIRLWNDCMCGICFLLLKLPRTQNDWSKNVRFPLGCLDLYLEARKHENRHSICDVTLQFGRRNSIWSTNAKCMM